MKVLTKNEIFQANDLPREAVPCPEWGEDAGVYVRTMTGEERDRFESAFVGKEANSLENIRAQAVALTACNEKGEPIFTNQDVIAIGKKSAKVLDRIFEVAKRLSGLGKKDVDELAKN